MTRMQIKRAIKWQNDMVMVFDLAGEQILELQGPYDDVRDRVLAASDDKTVFEHGVWMDSITSVPKEDW